jgi:hypothetical protein
LRFAEGRERTQLDAGDAGQCFGAALGVGERLFARFEQDCLAVRMREAHTLGIDRQVQRLFDRGSDVLA